MMLSDNPILKVVPGIRNHNLSDDQKRTMTSKKHMKMVLTSLLLADPSHKQKILTKLYLSIHSHKNFQFKNISFLQKITTP